MFTPAEHFTLCLVLAFFVCSNMQHAAPHVLLEYLARFLCALFFSFTTRDLTRHYLRHEYDFNYLLEALYASPLLLAVAGPDRCPLRALACWGACLVVSVLLYACARHALVALRARLCKRRPCAAARVVDAPVASHNVQIEYHSNIHTPAAARSMSSETLYLRVSGKLMSYQDNLKYLERSCKDLQIPVDAALQHVTPTNTLFDYETRALGPISGIHNLHEFLREFVQPHHRDASISQADPDGTFYTANFHKIDRFRSKHAIPVHFGQQWIQTTGQKDVWTARFGQGDRNFEYLRSEAQLDQHMLFLAGFSY